MSQQMTTSERQRFSVWMGKVDWAVEDALGVGTADLDDADYAGMWDDGMSVTECANRIIRRERE